MPAFTIRIRQNGPYLVPAEDVASLNLIDHEGNPIPVPEGQSVALCRCGGSSRKPFCDGHHDRTGFQGALAAVRAADATATDGGTTPR